MDDLISHIRDLISEIELDLQALNVENIKHHIPLRAEIERYDNNMYVDAGLDVANALVYGSLQNRGDRVCSEVKIYGHVFIPREEEGWTKRGYAVGKTARVRTREYSMEWKRRCTRRKTVHYVCHDSESEWEVEDVEEEDKEYWRDESLLEQNKYKLHVCVTLYLLY